MTHRHQNRKRRSRRHRSPPRDEEEAQSDDTVIEYTSGSEGDTEPDPPWQRKRWCCFHRGCAREILELIMACALLGWLGNNYAEKRRWFDTSPPGPPPTRIHTVDTSAPLRETGHLLSHYNLHSGRNRSSATADNG
jgi:hypothetical protein